MKRQNLITLITAIIFITSVSIFRAFFAPHNTVENPLIVGFIHEGDESIPYTDNFMRSQHKLKEQFGDRIKIYSRENVTPDYVDDVLDDLARLNCELIFTTSYSHAIVAKEFAEKHPKIQICQAAGDNAHTEPYLRNYHTFMGQIYQGRYISGIVAGMKLQEMINENKITSEKAKVGYVAAYPYPEVISGFTAFLLGVRSIVPTATMTVSYVYTWNSFSIEKNCAEHLIDEGCVIISQHSDTIGPASACEENFEKNVFHIGYNSSAVSMAPMTSLISTRVNWTPYIIGAVKAVIGKKSIEKTVKGDVHGNDISAGFDLDWVQMLELNTIIAAPGTQKKINDEIQRFKHGKSTVFSGDYIGVNPYDESDTIDLNRGFKENSSSSYPSFGYILKDVITVEE